MSKYTPSTDIVRAKYRYPLETPRNDAEFNRWLDEVKAEAWDEGKEDAMRGLDIHGDTDAENPYRKQEEA